jgi:predicted DNA-binding ribbon-helix-helix protein
VLMKDRREDSAVSHPLPLVDVQLDPVTWKVLQDIATQQGRSLRDLISDIARDVLSDAIRFYVTEFCRLAVAQH